MWILRYAGGSSSYSNKRHHHPSWGRRSLSERPSLSPSSLGIPLFASVFRYHSSKKRHHVSTRCNSNCSKPKRAAAWLSIITDLTAVSKATLSSSKASLSSQTQRLCLRQPCHGIRGNQFLCVGSRDVDCDTPDLLGSPDTHDQLNP